MTENAKMQPFYVVVVNETGRLQKGPFNADRQEGGLLCVWQQNIDAGTHRIEHIRDHSGLVDDLLAWRVHLSGVSATRDQVYTQTVIDELTAILSRHWRE